MRYRIIRGGTKASWYYTIKVYNIIYVDVNKTPHLLYSLGYVNDETTLWYRMGECVYLLREETHETTTNHKEIPSGGI